MNVLRSTLAAASLCAAACAHPGTPSPAPVAGRYELVSMDGRELPARSHGEAGYSVTNGSLALVAPDSAELALTVHREGAAGLLMRRVPGRYRTAGDSLTVTLPDGEMRGRADGALLTLRGKDGSVAVFRRQ